jgi:hypothetical protein
VTEPDQVGRQQRLVGTGVAVLGGVAAGVASVQQWQLPELLGVVNALVVGAILYQLLVGGGSDDSASGATDSAGDGAESDGEEL